MLDKHFPPHNKFNKIFNRWTVKVSYSCLPSMKSQINQHNKKILKPTVTNTEEEDEGEDDDVETVEDEMSRYAYGVGILNYVQFLNWLGEEGLE